MVGQNAYEQVASAGLRTVGRIGNVATRQMGLYASAQQGIYPGAFTAQMLGASQTTKTADYDIGQFSRQLKDLGSDLMGFRNALVNATKGIGVAAVENIAMTKVMIETANNAQKNVGGIGASAARQSLQSAVIQGMDRSQLMQNYQAMGTAGVLGMQGRQFGASQSFQGFNQQFAATNMAAGFGPQTDRYNQFAAQVALQQQAYGSRAVSTNEIMSQAGAIRMFGQSEGGLAGENRAITAASGLAQRYATGVRSGSGDMMGLAAQTREPIIDALKKQQEEYEKQIAAFEARLTRLPKGSAEYQRTSERADAIKNDLASVKNRIAANTTSFTPSNQARAESQSGVTEMDIKLKTEIERFGGQGSLYDRSNEGRNIAVNRIAQQATGGDIDAVEDYIASMRHREELAQKRERQSEALRQNGAGVVGSYRGDVRLSRLGYIGDMKGFSEAQEEAAGRMDPYGLQKESGSIIGGFFGTKDYEANSSTMNLRRLFTGTKANIVYGEEQGEMMAKQSERFLSVTREDSAESFKEYESAAKERIQNLNITDAQKARMMRVFADKAKGVDRTTGAGAAKVIAEGQELFKEYVTKEDSQLSYDMQRADATLSEEAHQADVREEYNKGNYLTGMTKQLFGGGFGSAVGEGMLGGAIAGSFGGIPGAVVGATIGGISSGAMNLARRGMLGDTVQEFTLDADENVSKVFNPLKRFLGMGGTEDSYDPNAGPGTGQNKLEQGQAGLVDLQTALMNLTSVLNNNVIPAFKQIPVAGQLADPQKIVRQAANATSAYGGVAGAKSDVWGTTRAFGGPVFAGQTTTVGERGVETFIPKQDGYILPAEATKRLRSEQENLPHAENGAQVEAGSPVVVGDGTGANAGPEQFVDGKYAKDFLGINRNFITSSSNFLSTHKSVSPFFSVPSSAKGTSSLMDVLQNAFNSVVNSPSNTSSNVAGTASPSGSQGGYGVPIRNIGLGSVAAQFESSGNYGAVSTGVGDHGGKSYGIFQLSSKAGSLNAFLSSSQYAGHFSGLAPGSPQFDEKWKSLGNDPGFAQEQLKYGQEKYYKPALENMAGMGIDLSRRGQAVQELIMSTAIQYGPANNKLSRVLQGKDLSALSDAEIIDLVQKSKAENIKGDFSSSSEDVQRGVLNRIERERKTLLSLLPQPSAAEETAPPEEPSRPPSARVADTIIPEVERKGGGLIFPGQIARVNEGGNQELIIPGTATSVLSKIETERFSENLNSSRMASAGRSSSQGEASERKVVVEINLPNQNISTKAEINFDDHSEKVKYLTIDPRDQWSMR